MRQSILTIVLILSAGATASELLSPEQREVWAGEEAYWTFVANHDVDGFMTLWDERFIGWACDAPDVENYDELRAIVPEWFSDVAADGNQTTIKPEAVIIDKQFAITFVAATTSSLNGTNVKSMKIVHTWRRTDDGWKIIGGMCGALER